MDWLLSTPQINSAFASLGSFEGDTYVVSPNALAILEEINYKLTYEDQMLRTFRRTVGFGQNVRTDLIPLLENAKNTDVLDAVIRILVNLTVPVECLFSVDIMYRTEMGRHTIFELNKLLYTSKEAFADPKTTKSVVEYMKNILESDSKLSPHKCDQINNCLLLLRNVLHIPETNGSFVMPSTHALINGVHVISMQNTIIWNLFIQSTDKLLLYLMTCPQRAFWGVTMVQLIAVMYKDQHVSTLQKLLNVWFEASLSESSEDNESNTSPPKQDSGDSSPMLTSDPTSDSSDNGGRKDEKDDEWRQSMREENVEATLQEVIRKGHAYKNSILRIPAEKHDSSAATDCLISYNSIKMEPMEATYEMEKHNDDDDDDDDDEEDDEDEKAENDFHLKAHTNPITTIKEEPEDMLYEHNNYNSNHNSNNNRQPAKQLAYTTKPIDVATFKSPRALPMKVAFDKCQKMPEVTQKLCQKVPHSGQLNLTKGKCCPQKRECASSQSELSDCGYATQVENQESISTSSNDDDSPQAKPQHQKPPCSVKLRNKQQQQQHHQRIPTITSVDKKELRRKKLVKRSKSSLINMKGLVQHIPTDEDISNLLKEFTVDFLLKGYDYLVEELHAQLLTNLKIPIDTSHFFWLVTYFLKFAAQLELDMEHINSILTYDIISYLTYEGVTLCEQFEINSRQKGNDLKPYLRRMHLVVTAIREFLQAVETYKKVTHLSEEDRQHLRQLQIQISGAEDLRCLFVLLLRRFNPSLHSKQYLQDLVVTNHLLLLILDGVTQSDDKISIKMVEHIAQFATLEVMHYYGMLLEDFNSNGEFVNSCIFTMMHHIGGDLGQIGTLFQPVILKTYSRIWEADYELCDDWSDLIEYVIHKFVNTPQKSPLTLPTISLTELTKEHNSEHTVCTWSQEEMDTLYWYYVQSKKSSDVVGRIVNLFTNNGNKQKSRISIIQQLLQQDIITLVEYDDLMKFEDAEYQCSLLATPTPSTTESGIELKDISDTAKPFDDLQIIRDLLVKEDKDKNLIWLQKILLECCYIKLVFRNSVLRKDHQNLKYIMEPVAYHCILKHKSVPVVQWNSEQASIMLYQPFVLLLHKLGLQLPADAGSVFAHIPDYWTAEMMYGLARKLGPFDKLFLKFDVSQLKDTVDTEDADGLRYDLTAARNSLSSISSLEIDTSESDEWTARAVVAGHRMSMPYALSPVPEIDVKTERGNEIFAIPQAKHCNSIIRFTPDPETAPSVPNWLQLVMRNKCNQSTAATSSKSVINDGNFCMTSSNSTSNSGYSSIYSTTTTTTTPKTSNATTQAAHIITTATTTLQKQQQQQHKSKHGSVNNSKEALRKNEQQRSATNISSSRCNNNSNIKDENNNSEAEQQQQQQHEQHQQQLSYQLQQLQNHLLQSDDSITMKSLERKDSGSSGIFTRSGSGNLDSDYSAMIASVYASVSDTASVTSDLTQMYVSDEDEKPEHNTHF